MAWLVSDGVVMASAEVADDRRAKRRGLLGREGIEGCLVIERCQWIHTMRMRFALDVAFVDKDGSVIKTMRMRPNRIGVPVRGASAVIEAQAGAFSRWGLHVGDVVELRP